MIIQLEAQPLGEFDCPFRRSKAYGENDEVELLLSCPEVRTDKRDHQVLRLGLFRNPGDHGANETDAVVVLRPFDVSIKILPVGPNIHIEDRRLCLGMVLLEDDRLLHGVHAADRAAIVPIMIPRSHALDKGDLLRLPMIGPPA